MLQQHINGMTPYCQDGIFNPEHPGNVRWFATLTEAQVANPFLKALIDFNLCQLPVAEDWAHLVIQVGVHAIRIVARPGRPGISSPDLFHRDGENFTFIHLIEIKDVEGGVSTVASNDRIVRINGLPKLTAQPNFTVRLLKPLETLAINDGLVWHHVGPITVKPGFREGWRSVLLIDFCPLVPNLTKNS